MARGDSISEIYTLPADGSYVVLDVPADEEWLMTAWGENNNNATLFYAVTAGSTDYVWLMDANFIATNRSVDCYNMKVTFNPGHEAVIRATGGSEKFAYVGGYKTKDTS